MNQSGDVQTRVVDAVVVGAGFAGMQALYRLRAQGLTVQVFETGSDVGGTWFWNRYPGARCDIESMEYSYQFSPELQQEWDWSERHATQPEILRYANHVADRFQLRKHIRFDCTVTRAQFDETCQQWVVETSDEQDWRARYLVLAVGCLSSANLPRLRGLDVFEGQVLHTGRWPVEGVSFAGQRVGVIGTGSSGIQAIPIIAEQARSLTVFQRTANYSIPAGNGPLDFDFKRSIKSRYAQFRAANALRPGAFGSRFPSATKATLEASAKERQEDFELRWRRGGFGFLGGFTDLWTNPQANFLAAEFVRDKIRSIVDDPQVAELLCPEQVIGCKRICLDTGYYAAFNRPNVELVDVRSTPIECLSPSGLRTSSEHFELDMLVCATGFDAMTGAMLRIDIIGREGTSLGAAWSGGPRTYLGLCTAGFPNMFVIAGPGSPSVLTNMLVSIDQHVNWVGDCIEYLSRHDWRSIEAGRSAQDDWVAHGNEVADATLYPTCNSWYVGANIPGKPRVFLPYSGGFPAYKERCDAVAANDYEGFILS